MKSEQQLRETYADLFDLLDGAADDELTHIIGDLDALYSAPVPPARLHTAFNRALAERARSAVDHNERPLRADAAVPRWRPPRARHNIPPPSPSMVSPRGRSHGWLRQGLGMVAATLAFALIAAILVLVFRPGDTDDEGDIRPGVAPIAGPATVHEILFVGQDGLDRSIYSVRSDGSKLEKVHPGTGASVWALAWSPDGQWIAFSSSMNGQFEIYVMNANGGEVRQLTSVESDTADLDPVWSPDGTHIAFMRGGNQQSDIYVMDAEGSDLVNITQGIGGIRPVWSPDGSQLAFEQHKRSGDEHQVDLWVVNSDGTDSRKLADDGVWNTNPDWFPDGRRILFTSDRNGNTDQYVINADGSGLQQLTDSPSNDVFGTWSPDGEWIAFVSDRDGGGEESIYVMPADGTNPTPIVTHEDGKLGQVFWSPDGQQIAYLIQEGDPNREGATAKLAVAERDGTNQRVIAENVAIGAQPVWRPVPVQERADAIATSTTPPSPTVTPTMTTTTGDLDAALAEALAALSEDERGCDATPAQAADDDRVQVQGSTLVGEGQLWADYFPENRPAEPGISAGKGTVIYWKLDEHSIDTPAIVAEQIETGTKVRPEWGPVLGSSGWRGGVWRTIFTFPEPGCWQFSVIQSDSAGVLWLEVVPRSPMSGTAFIDAMQPLKRGEERQFALNVQTDMRLDEGALLAWSVEGTERILEDGSHQEHIVVRDLDGNTVAEYISDGDRWWWNQHGWIESGDVQAGILEPPTEIRLGQQELHMIRRALSDPPEMEIIEQFQEESTQVTRYKLTGTEWMGQQFGIVVTGAYYEVRLSTVEPRQVIAARTVLVGDEGQEYALAETTYRKVVIEQIEPQVGPFVIPNAPSEGEMQYIVSAPAGLPKGLGVARHWRESPGGFERLTLNGDRGVKVDVFVYPSRGGFDPRSWQSRSRPGTGFHTVETSAGPVVWMGGHPHGWPVRAIWDDGRYRFEVNITYEEDPSLDERQLRELVEALSSAS